MVIGPMDDKGPKVPPTHPPRTPPPQKKPVEPPRPQPSTRPVSTSLPLPGPGQARPEVRRPRLAIKDRRAANWALTGYPWAAAQVLGKVTETVRKWGYRHPGDEALERTVRLLVDAAVGGGRRISVHLADQDGMILVVVLGHTGTGTETETETETDEKILSGLAAVPGTASCGTDASDDGRRVWAVLSTTSPGPRATTAAWRNPPT